ncbi:MAG: hypothetical protein K6F80_05695 [Oscillospiraceae bacterium]|nr:hypothetical protein [Oscillospiraceae bacterium]
MDEKEQTVTKYKIICRIQDGRYTEELRCNDNPRTAPYTSEEERAFALLHSFSPEQRTRQLCREVPGSVLVFRTDAVQLAEMEAVTQK